MFTLYNQAPVLTQLNSERTLLKSSSIDTKLGPMIAIANDNELVLLEFVDRRDLERELQKLKKRTVIMPGITNPIISIKKELTAYFDGKLQKFKTPVSLNGTNFQKKVWTALKDIPYGTTRSYSDLSQILNIRTATRAVASGIGTNQLAIIIPCHRVINKNGRLGGYSGGLRRKKWLLNFEKKA